MAKNVVVPPFDTAPVTVVGTTPQSVFPFDFPFWEESDILVFIDGEQLVGGYSVQGSFVQNGTPVEGGYGSGTVTLNTPVASVSLMIDRFVEGARESQYSRAAPLGMPALNADLNKVTARQQDVARLVRRIQLDGLTTGLDAAAARDALGIKASVIGWINGLVGGVARFISDKLGDTVSVKDFGALCDGVTDDTAAWQAAHDSLSPIWGGKIVAPNGKHLLGTVTISRRCMEIEAAGEVIAKNSTGHVIYNPVGRYMKINGMKMVAAPGVTRSADAYIYLGPNAQFAQIKGVNFSGHYVGIEMDGGSISVVRDCEFRDPTKSSEHAGGAHIAIGRNNLVTAPLIDSVVTDTDEAGSGLPVPGDMISYGIALYYVDAAIIANCDIIRSGKDLAMIPASGQVVANTKICNSFFDTAEYGVYIVPATGGAVARTAFINSWSSNHSNRNVLLFGNGPVIGTKFVGSEFQISKGDAFLLGGNVTDTVIDRNTIAGNAGSAVSVGSGVTKLRITNNKIGPNDDFGPNGFGVFIGTGCSDYVVRDNDLRGNTGAGLSDSSNAADGYIVGNQGVVTKNRGSDTIASAASSKVITHGAYRTPVASDLSITPNVALGTNNLWVDPATITSTQFTVKTGNGAAAADLAFSWRLDMEKI